MLTPDVKRRLVIFREMSEKADYGFRNYDTRALPQKQSLIRLKTALNLNATSLLSQIAVSLKYVHIVFLVNVKRTKFCRIRALIAKEKISIVGIGTIQ